MKNCLFIFPRYQVVCLPLVALACVCSAAAQTISYEGQIAPLLDTYCIDCHGDADADGEFRVDSYSNLIAGGESGKAIEAGRGAESLLVKFLEGTSGREGKNQFMPPGKRDKMKPEEIALIRSWIDAGAKGPSLAEAKKAEPRQVVTPSIAPKGKTMRAVQAVAYSAKANLLAVGRYGEVELVDPVSRQVVRKLAGLKGKVNAVAFAPDGATLYAAGGEPGIGGAAHAWRVPDGVMTQTYAGHVDACYALAVSPDGKVVATGAYDQRIKLWEAVSGKELATLAGHNGAISGLAFRPDGKVLASASADRTVKLWSLPKGERLDTLSQPTKEQAAVSFSVDGKQLYAGGADNRIRVWSVSASAKEGGNSLLMSRFAHEGGILGLAISGDGKMLASTAADKSVKVWQTSGLTEKVLLEKQGDWAPALAFDGKSQLFVGRVDGTLAAYASADGKLVTPPKPKPAVKPEISRIEPPAIGAVGEFIVQIVGKNLNAAGLSAKTSNPAIIAELATGAAKAGEVTVRMTTKGAPRGPHDVWLANSAGASARLKLYVEDMPLVVTTGADFKTGPARIDTLPAVRWGVLTEIGQHDAYLFQAAAGDELILDLAVAQIGSKAKSPTLEIVDADGIVLAVNRGLDSGSDPFLDWKAPADGRYEVRISNTTMDGSADHRYRLTMGALPFVTGWFPLSAQVGKETTVRLIGHHLGSMGAVKITPEKEGGMTVPLPAAKLLGRGAPMLALSALPHFDETEPNNDFARAQAIQAPATVNAVLDAAGTMEPDADSFAFESKAGQQWVIETLAAPAGSPADTKVEVLHADGRPVERLLLQSVRDSYNNFRSVDANNPDIRLQNWAEMELNEYVYFNGDIMRIFRMPRGPDAGVFFYTINGMRRSYFDTSATAHPLDEACYVVEPKPLGSALVPNGLPVFTLSYANDDAGDRKGGRDSRLTFTAPADGRYIARVGDTRGWGGARFVYALTVRQPRPGFALELAGANPSVAPGSSIGFSIKADRRDGYEGPIVIDVAGVPEGYFVSSPLLIEAGHTMASGSLHAAPGAKADADWSKATVVGRADVQGKEMRVAVTGFGKVTLGPPAKAILVLEPDQNGRPAMRTLAEETKPLELVIAPGKSVKAWLRAVRVGNEGLLSLDLHNLPHGIIVDDIGLNGVQIREKETERPIFLRAAKWVGEQDRLCHAALSSARSDGDSAGVQTSFPILLKVRKDVAVSAR